MKRLLYKIVKIKLLVCIWNKWYVCVFIFSISIYSERMYVAEISSCFAIASLYILWHIYETAIITYWRIIRNIWHQTPFKFLRNDNVNYTYPPSEIAHKINCFPFFLYHNLIENSYKTSWLIWAYCAPTSSFLINGVNDVVSG